MRTFARAYDDIWKKLYPRVASRGLKWENKTYKLKRSIRLTQCCTQFRSLGVKVVCVFYLHDNIVFTFKWYGNTWNKTFYSQKIWIGYNIELAELVYRRERETNIRRWQIPYAHWPPTTCIEISLAKSLTFKVTPLFTPPPPLFVTCIN